MKEHSVKVKVIIEKGITTGILADGDVNVEIINIDPDYEALRKYEDELRDDPSLKERKFTVANFEEAEK